MRKTVSGKVKLSCGHERTVFYPDAKVRGEHKVQCPECNWEMVTITERIC